MSPQTLEKISTDWFDLVRQTLDDLRQDCLEVEDKTTVPPDARFEMAKAEVEKLRRLAEFPNMPEANVWIGQSGELGVTWRFMHGTLELLFVDKMYARVYNDKEQAQLNLSEVPRVLSKLAA